RPVRRAGPAPRVRGRPGRGGVPALPPARGDGPRARDLHAPGPSARRGLGRGRRCGPAAPFRVGRAGGLPLAVLPRAPPALVAHDRERGLMPRAPQQYAVPYPHPSGATAPAIPAEFVPNHVAVVMDGNGRWANARGLPRVEGHKEGEKSLLDVVAGAVQIGV